jgi:hypothetical protein
MAANSLPFSIHRVLMPDGSGFRDLLCLVPPGWGFDKGLPSVVIVGALRSLHRHLLDSGDYPLDISPENFIENRVFRDLFHEIVRRFASDEPGFGAEARRLGSGFVYVIDSRTPDPGGEVPSEDIVGGFEVRGGAVVGEAYFANPHFRLIGKNGFFTLSGWLSERLLEEIVRRTAHA